MNVTLTLTPAVCKAFLPYLDDAVAAVKLGSSEMLAGYIRRIAEGVDAIKFDVWLTGTHADTMRYLCRNVRMTTSHAADVYAALDSIQARLS